MMLCSFDAVEFKIESYNCLPLPILIEIIVRHTYNTFCYKIYLLAQYAKVQDLDIINLDWSARRGILKVSITSTIR